MIQSNRYTALIILVGLLFFTTSVQAQETTTQESNSEQNRVSQTIIVQTDSEEPIKNQTLLCRQTPKKLGIVTASETILHEVTTNELGVVILMVTDGENSIFSCTSKELTTPDYCWYFPHPTISFELSQGAVDNSENLDGQDNQLNQDNRDTQGKRSEKPVYLIGQLSPDTCNKELTEQELKNGITNLLPQGTALPFTNKNLIPPTPEPEIIADDTKESEQEITLWQWIMAKLRSLFS